MKQIKKTITKAEIAAMPKVLFPGRIFVIYTESEAEKAVAYLKDQRIVGVDTETRPSFKRGTTHKVALLFLLVLPLLSHNHPYVPIPSGNCKFPHKPTHLWLHIVFVPR